MFLSLIFFICFSAIFIIFFTSKLNVFLLRLISVGSTGLIFLLSCALFTSFQTNVFPLQEIVVFNLGFQYLNLYLSFGLDGFSILFFLLSSFLIFLCNVFVWNEKLLKEYALTLLCLDLLLLLVFSAIDLLLFYIFFEAILIPMYLLVGIWGSRERKIRAVYLLFFYTLLGSLCMLIGILYIYSLTGTLNFEYLLNYPFSSSQQYWLWLSFFLSFSTKIPMFPFHIWLPEAHVEAPTVGSVLLAGILLKLGVYGFLRFSLLLFPEMSLFFAPFVYLLSTLGVIYASLTAIRQTDLKRIIAYSSIAHMNLITLGIFSFSIFGIEGAILQSLSHGFVSGGLFLLVGIIYNRYHDRLLYSYGGLVHVMPIYSFLFLIFTLANIALPGTSSFIGEFLLLLGVYQFNSVTALFAASGVILAGAYSLWCYNRIIFGNLKIYNTLLFKDVTFLEFSLLCPLLFLIFFVGINPTFFIQYTHLFSSTVFLLTQ